MKGKGAHGSVSNVSKIPWGTPGPNVGDYSPDYMGSFRESLVARKRNMRFIVSQVKDGCVESGAVGKI